eukprot:1144555-Pelagomonas_calceolata.AAC.3
MGGRPKATEDQVACVASLTKEQPEEGRRSENTTKAKSTQVGRAHEGNQSRSAERKVWGQCKG